MTSLSAPRVAAAVVCAVLLNGAGLILMVNINSRIVEQPLFQHAQIQMIRFEEPQVEPKRPRVSAKGYLSRASRAPQTLPKLPTVMPNMGDRLGLATDMDLLSDMFAGGSPVLGELIFKEEAVEMAPAVIARVEPRYPPRAEARGIEGHVLLKVRISPHGRVERVWTVESNPPGVFDAAAERAVRQYVFSPARHRGVTVPVVAKLRIDFELGH